MRASVDTNVLVYATSPAEGAKETAARTLLAQASQEGWSVPAQVYGEFFSLMTRKQYMTRKAASDAVDAFAAVMPPLSSSVAAHAAALKLAARKQVQYWDALIIAVCAENGVKQLFTEDIASAPKLLGVKLVSPF